MTTGPRKQIQIKAAVFERLSAEADLRVLSASKLAEVLIERGLGQLPPLPSAASDGTEEAP